jgi:hypothetical protein
MVINQAQLKQGSATQRDKPLSQSSIHTLIQKTEDEDEEEEEDYGENCSNPATLPHFVATKLIITQFRYNCWGLKIENKQTKQDYVMNDTCTDQQLLL